MISGHNSIVSENISLLHLCPVKFFIVRACPLGIWNLIFLLLTGWWTMQIHYLKMEVYNLQSNWGCNLQSKWGYTLQPDHHRQTLAASLYLHRTFKIIMLRRLLILVIMCEFFDTIFSILHTLLPFSFDYCVSTNYPENERCSYFVCCR